MVQPEASNASQVPAPEPLFFGLTVLGSVVFLAALAASVGLVA